MAIYSCNLKSIGRTTHRSGTGGAHIRYISRPDAAPTILAENMPYDPGQARNWIDRAERAGRKNARVLDKIRLALPRELDEVQRAALVEEYMADLTAGRRVPWYAAIHQTGKDAHNPHVHIAVHDRDRDTGKRVLRLSDSTRDRLKGGLPGPKAVDWIRERWELVCNRALEREGHEARIDRRTLKAQGIDRLATIHVGPRASHIDGNVKRPRSRRRTNGCGRVIDYPAIDNGVTRREFNAQVIDLNLERAIRSGNPVAAAWAAFERDQMARDGALEDRLAAALRKRTAERRDTARRYNSQLAERGTALRRARRDAEQKVRRAHRSARDSLRERHRSERDRLKARQGGLYLRIIAILDATGTARRRHEEARKALSAIHKEERYVLTEKYRQARETAAAAVEARYDPQIGTIRDRKAQHLDRLRAHRAAAERQADAARQERETEREHARQITQSRIRDWQKDAGSPQHGKAAPTRSDALARAIARTQSQDQQRPRNPGGGRERKR